MKKKRYFQNDIPFQCFWLIISCFTLGLIGYNIYSFITNIIPNIGKIDATKLLARSFRGFAEILLCVFMCIVIIGEESCILYMDDNKIWMNADKRAKSRRLQYKAKADFSEIKSIRIIHNSKNSKQTYPSFNRFYPSLQYYLVLTKKNGRSVYMNVTNFTKDYLIEIISEIIIRVNATGNIYEGNNPIWIVNHIKSE